MKKFVCGFLAGALIFGSIASFAASYVAETAGFKVMVNGKEFTSDPPALVVEGRTYLPLRAIGDALGVPVGWNEELAQAEVGTAPLEETSYSRNNPAPLNTVQTYTQENEYLLNDYSAAIRVMEAIRGDAAWEKIKEANMFNSEPEEGYEYVLVKVAFSVLSVEDDAAHNVNTYYFKTFSSNNEEMPGCYAVAPEPNLTGQLYAGGNTEGWVALQVKKDDPAPKLAYGQSYDGKDYIWFSLQ